MPDAADHWIFASYIHHLEKRIGTRLTDTERRQICEFARGYFEKIGQCNALFNGVTRAIHLTEVVLATLEGQWLRGKQVDPNELRHVLLAVWCHSAAFADTLPEDDRLPLGIPNDGWWPWVHDRSATLCTRAAQAMSGIDVARLIALSQACGFAPVAVNHRPDVTSVTNVTSSTNGTQAPDTQLIQRVRAAWLISLASDADQSSKLKPLWTALRYWSGQNECETRGVLGEIPEWIDFPAQWKGMLSQWSRTAMAPAIELLELTEDGRDHLEHLRRALQ
jgi:hypothetical protein